MRAAPVADEERMKRMALRDRIIPTVPARMNRAVRERAGKGRNVFFM
jgi:hypothetical protein